MTTQPRFPSTSITPVSLPPLRIGVFTRGELVHTFDIPDPRVAVCKHYAELNRDEESVARPLPLSESAESILALATSKRRKQ